MAKYPIEVEIGADGVEVFKKSMQDLNDELKELQKKLKSTTGVKEFAEVNSKIKETKKQVEELNKLNVDGFGKGVKKGANEAGQSLVNLGRVAQDAPFGFIGIQNNINPLLESFQRLKTETGTTGGALKALGSSLTGAAGIGLAISVVTGLVTAAIQKYGSLGNAINAVFGATTTLEQANRDLAKSFAESEGSVAGELATVRALVSIAQNKALADVTRQQAIDKLNKEYDTYLPKLTLENIGTKAVNESVNKLTQSLVRQAKVRGLQDLISKESAKQAELLSNDLTDNLGILGEIAAIGKAGFSGLTLAQQRVVEGAKATGEQYSETQIRVERFTKALNDLTNAEAAAGTLAPNDKDKKERVAAQVDQLQKQIDALNKVRAVQKTVVDEQVKGYQDARAAADALVATEQKLFDLRVKVTLRDAKKNGLDKSEVNDLIKTYQKQLNDAFDIQATVREADVRLKPVITFNLADLNTDAKEVNSNIQKALHLDKDIPIKATASVVLGTVGLDIRKGIVALETIKKEFLKTVDGIIQDTLVNAAVAIGEGIGNVFSGQGFKSLFAPLLGVIASALIELGKAVISYGIAMEAIQEALKSAFENPYVAIAAGIAAVAVGQILKSKAQKSSQKFEGGGVATGPSTGYQVTLHGTEAIVPLKNNRYPFGVNSQQGSQELFAVIRGRDIHLSNQRTTNSRRRL